MAWFHCFAGIAGDMALGSSSMPGADVDEVRALLNRLDLPGWDLQVEAATPRRHRLHAGDRQR